MPYFSEDVGIPVPPFMNPADYFMDCIATKYKPAGRPDFGPTDLFPLWDDGNGGGFRNKYERIANGDDYVPWPPLGKLRIASEVLRSKKSCPPLVAIPIFMRRQLLQMHHSINGLYFDCTLQFSAGCLLGLIYKDVDLTSIGEVVAMIFIDESQQGCNVICLFNGQFKLYEPSWTGAAHVPSWSWPHHGSGLVAAFWLRTRGILA